MLFNATFSTTRKALADGKRTHTATTITNAAGFFAPARAETKAVLGIDLAVKSWELMTDETDFEEGDKVVLNTVTYYIEDIEQIEVNGVQLTRLVLLKQE